MEGEVEGEGGEGEGWRGRGERERERERANAAPKPVKLTKKDVEDMARRLEALPRDFQVFILDWRRRRTTLRPFALVLHSVAKDVCVLLLLQQQRATVREVNLRRLGAELTVLLARLAERDAEGLDCGIVLPLLHKQLGRSESRVEVGRTNWGERNRGLRRRRRAGGGGGGA